MYFYLSKKMNEIIIIIIIVCCIFFCFTELCSDCCSNFSNTNNSFDTNTTNNILHDNQCDLTSTSKSFTSIEI